MDEYAKYWETERFRLNLATPRIMGIVNATPDSFSDGGLYDTQEKAIAKARQLLRDGADILDIGGESTRPGAAQVSVREEIDRVVPVISALSTEALVSVDTSKPEVMREAINAGAAIVNDVYALRKPKAEDVVVKSGCAVCLMHMQGDPATMQDRPQYKNFMEEVTRFLLQRADALQKRGVSKLSIALDPGFGFGKTVSQNFELLAKAENFAKLGYPLLYGMSRKSSLGAVTGKSNPQERLISSVVSHLMAVERGVRIVRVHDVKEMKEAIQIYNSVKNYGDL